MKPTGQSGKSARLSREIIRETHGQIICETTRQVGQRTIARTLPGCAARRAHAGEIGDVGLNRRRQPVVRGRHEQGCGRARPITQAPAQDNVSRQGHNARSCAQHSRATLCSRPVSARLRKLAEYPLTVRPASAASPRPGVLATRTRTLCVPPGAYFFGGLFPLPPPDLLPVVEGAFAGLPPPLLPFAIVAPLNSAVSSDRLSIVRRAGRPYLGVTPTDTREALAELPD